MRRVRIPGIALILAAIAALVALSGGHALAHGTLNLFGQSAEHEKLTRAATACAPGFKTADVPGRCFEPLSEDQLAGTSSNLKTIRPIRIPAGVLKPTAVAVDLPAIDPLVAGTIGAVGAPDIETFFFDTPHCTAGDYINIAGYPQTRAEADAALMRLSPRAPAALPFRDRLRERPRRRQWPDHPGRGQAAAATRLTSAWP